MEKIVSVMSVQQGQKSLGLGKLKLNQNDLSSKNIKKTLTHVTKNLSEEEVNLENVHSALTNLLGYDCEIENIKRVEGLNLYLGKNETYDNYVAVDVPNYNGSNRIEKTDILTVYIDMSGKVALSKHGASYYWKKNSEHYGQSDFKVLNGKRLIASYLLWDKMTPETDELFWEKYEYMDAEIMFENMDLGLDDFVVSLSDLKEYFIDNLFYTRHKRFGRKLYDDLILEMILDECQEVLNIELMDKYVETQETEVATALQTKKNISGKILKAMEETKFLNNGFSYVEFDNQTDLEKISYLEEEWLEIKPKLTKLNVQPKLRFRKLGKHNATGLYSPRHNTICIDIRNVKAMIHEVGHLIDFNLGTENISMSDDFKPILKSYREQVALLPSDSYVLKKKNYYLTPTEVFARAYELFMSDKLNTSFLQSTEKYNQSDEYTCFTEKTRLEIEDFMNQYL